MREKFKVLFLMLIFLTSCNNTTKVENFYESGNIESIVTYKEGIPIDSSIYFYDNKESALKAVKFWNNGEAVYQKDYFISSQLKREGRLLKDKFRIGKWKLYNASGNLSEIIEYINVNDTSYLNQSWKIGKDLDTLSGGNSYKVIRIKDTVKYVIPNRIHIWLSQPLFYNSNAFVCIPKKGQPQLKQDFSNEGDILWDTINNMSIEFKDHSVYKFRKYDIIFDLYPRTTGKDTLSGFVVEKEMRDVDSIDFVTRKIYFRLPYYILP